MSKKRARLRFVWITLLVALGLFFALAAFDVPWSFDKYNGFAGAIELGLDLKGGQAVVFDVEADGDKEEAIDKSLKKINDLVKRGDYIKYDEAKISRQGDQVRVEVFEANDDFFGWISNPQKVSITINEYSAGEETPTVYIASNQIAGACFGRRVNDDKTAYEFGVELDLTSNGKTTLKSLLRQGNEILYVYLGDVEANNLLGTIDAKGQSGENMFVESDSMLSDYNKAFENAYNIASGTLGVTLGEYETFDFSPILGEHTLIFVAIAAAVALVLIMLLLWARYGDFGLLADFAMLVFAVLMLFFMQAIPLISLTMPSIIAILLSIALFVDANVVVFERIRQEYAQGKKIPLAVKGGFKHTFWTIFDSHVVVAVISLILYFVGGAAIKSFAFPLFVGAFVSFFTNQVIVRFFLKSYLPLNSTKPKKLRLYREKGVVEIKEDESEPAKDEGINILAPENNAGGEN